MINYAERSFGVEIECSSPSTGEYDDHWEPDTLGVYGTSNLLRQNGYPEWADHVTNDGSEIEIPSPILRGTDGLKQLKGVMSLLKSNGFYTTGDDGMHVHFDAHDLNESDMLRVIRSWDNNRGIVQKFLGERFNNSYCGYDYHWNNNSDLYCDYPETDESLWQYDGEKCFAIEPRASLRTLEFRQHYGTLDFDEARAWILLCQAFIKTVKETKEEIRKVSMSELFKLTRTYKVARNQLANRSGYREQW